MTRAIGSLNMGLCRVLLAPWMTSRRCALKTGVFSFLGTPYSDVRIGSIYQGFSFQSWDPGYCSSIHRSLTRTR